MGKYYRNRLPVKNEGKEGDLVGGIYRGLNYIAVKAPEGWIISAAFPINGKGNNEITINFPAGGCIVFRNAYDEKIFKIGDKGTEVFPT